MSAAAIPRYVTHAWAHSPVGHSSFLLVGGVLFPVLALGSQLEWARAGAMAAATCLLAAQAVTTLGATPPALPMNRWTQVVGGIVGPLGPLVAGTLFAAALLPTVGVPLSLGPLEALSAAALVLLPTPGLVRAWDPEFGRREIPTPVALWAAGWMVVLASWAEIGTLGVAALALTAWVLPRQTAAAREGGRGLYVQGRAALWAFTVLQLPLLVGTFAFGAWVVAQIWPKPPPAAWAIVMGLGAWCVALPRRSMQPPGSAPFKRASLEPLRVLPVSAATTLRGMLAEILLAVVLVPVTLTLADTSGWLTILEPGSASIAFVSLTVWMQAVRTIQDVRRSDPTWETIALGAAGAAFLVQGLTDMAWATGAAAAMVAAWSIVHLWWWQRTPR